MLPANFLQNSGADPCTLASTTDTMPRYFAHAYRTKDFPGVSDRSVEVDGNDGNVGLAFTWWLALQLRQLV